MIQRKTVRGITPIVGILILVGIFFSSIIPMYVYINQLDSYYDAKVADMRLSDQERDLENLELYVAIEQGPEANLNTSFLLKNKGPNPLEVVRIWAARTDLKSIVIYDNISSGDSSHVSLPILPLRIPPKSDYIIYNTTFPGAEQNETFIFEAVSGRGKIYIASRPVVPNPRPPDPSHVFPVPYLISANVKATGSPGDKYSFELTVYNWEESWKKVMYSPEVDSNNVWNPQFGVPYPGWYTVTCVPTKGRAKMQEFTFELTEERPKAILFFNYDIKK